jgi:hypothetical protein
VSDGIASDEWYVTGYLGNTYIIRVTATNSYYGQIVRTFSVTFPGSSLPFKDNIVVSWVCIGILFIMFLQFGRMESKVGMIIASSAAWVMIGLGLFEPLDTWIPGISTLITVTNGAVFTLTILNYNKQDE